MAILKIKQLMEDLINDTHVALSANVSLVTKATSSGYSGTAAVAATGTSGSQL